jgi:hypothetical protein
MLLSVHERLILLGVIQLGAPKSGNLLTMRIVHDLQMELSFTEGERAEKKLEIREDGNATWVESVKKDINIGLIATDIIKKGLTEALPQWDAAEALEIPHISLFKRFEVDMTLPEPEQVEARVLTADGIVEPEA